MLDEVAKHHEATVAQLCLAWLLHRSPVTAAHPGHEFGSSTRRKTTAAADLKLSDDEWAQVEAAATRKKRERMFTTTEIRAENKTEFYAGLHGNCARC